MVGGVKEKKFEEKEAAAYEKKVLLRKSKTIHLNCREQGARGRRDTPD